MTISVDFAVYGCDGRYGFELHDHQGPDPLGRAQLRGHQKHVWEEVRRGFETQSPSVSHKAIHEVNFLRPNMVSCSGYIEDGLYYACQGDQPTQVKVNLHLTSSNILSFHSGFMSLADDLPVKLHTGFSASEYDYRGLGSSTQDYHRLLHDLANRLGYEVDSCSGWVEDGLLHPCLEGEPEKLKVYLEVGYKGGGYTAFVVKGINGGFYTNKAAGFYGNMQEACKAGQEFVAQLGFEVGSKDDLFIK